MSDQDIVLEAEFDPKVITYWYLQGVWVHVILCTAIIGCVTLPIWLAVGWFVCNTRYKRQSMVLTKKAVLLKKGALVRVEKTVPLEQIQDLSLRSGPLLDAFGVASVQIETAGQTGPGSDLGLEGLKDAKAFRDAVMAERDNLLDRRAGGGAAAAAPANDEVVEVLKDIRDTLQRLEKRLDEKEG